MPLSKETKQEIIKKIAQNEKNTGDTAVQIALITERLNHLSKHLAKHKKDFVTQRSLVKLVHQRKKLLEYLKRKNLNKYRELIKQLDIRK